MRKTLLSLIILLSSTIATYADDFDIMRQNLREHVTLGKTDYNPEMPEMRTYLNDLNRSASAYMSTMRHDTTFLWDDIAMLRAVPSLTPAHINASYQRLLDMTRAWAYPGGKLYQDTMLLREIRYGLKILSEVAYNKQTKRIGNWWEWRIGVPWNYGHIVSILYEQLTGDEIKQYEQGVATFIRSFTRNGDLTYANQASICRNLLVLGILTNNKTDVRNALRYTIPAFADNTSPQQRMAAIRRQDGYISRQRQTLQNVSLLKNKEGLYEDGSFIQHNAIPYIGTYGVEIIQMAAYMARITEGTELKVPEEITEWLPIWINNAYLPAMYRGEMMIMLMGRANDSNPYNNARLAALSIMDAALLINDSTLRTQALTAAANTLIHDPHHKSPYSELAPLPIYKPIIDTAAEYASEDGEEPFALMLAAGDKLIHQTAKWRACVSMSSNRIGKYECFIRATGRQNTRGWYSGDGMTYLYLPDDPKQFYQYMQAVNTYRLPGTTIDVMEREEVESVQPLYGHTAQAADSARAGGTTLGEKYSSAMMQLIGGASLLKAKKSWFILPEGIVCLGSDIHLNDEREVITTVENRRFAKSLYIRTKDGGQSVSNAKNKTIEKSQWAHLDGTAGYIFFDTCDVIVNQPENGNTEIMLSHGVKPDSGRYAYMILPALSITETEAYAKNPTIQILSNSRMLQAVSKPSAQTVAANFWGETELQINDSTTLRSDGTAAIILRTAGDTLYMSIADPTWDRNRQTLQLTGNYTLQEQTAKDNVNTRYRKGITRISINQRRRLGMTQNLVLLRAKDNTK